MIFFNLIFFKLISSFFTSSKTTSLNKGPLSSFAPHRLLWVVAPDGEATALSGTETEVVRERPTIDMLRQALADFETYLIDIEPTPENFKIAFNRADQLYVHFCEGLYDGNGEEYVDVQVEDRAYILNALEELRTFLLYDFNNAATLVGLFELARSDFDIILDVYEATRSALRSSPSRLLARVLMRRKNQTLVGQEQNGFVFGEELRTRISQELVCPSSDVFLRKILDQMRSNLSGHYRDAELDSAFQDRVFSFLDQSSLLSPHLKDLPEVLVYAALNPSFEERRLGLELAYLRQDPGQISPRQGIENGGKSPVMELMKALRARIFELLQTNRRDPLTGLLNRQAWEEDSQKPERNKRQQTLVLADLNGLKLLNEAVASRNVKDLQGDPLQGHALGDYVLKKMGEAFLETLRETDFGYRCGDHGDEFVFILPKNTSQGDVMALVRRLDSLIIQIEEELDLYIYKDFIDREMSYKENQKFSLGIAFAVARYFPPETKKTVSSGTPVSLGSMLPSLDQLLGVSKMDSSGKPYPLEDRAAIVFGQTITGDGVQRIPLREKEGEVS